MAQVEQSAPSGRMKGRQAATGNGDIEGESVGHGKLLCVVLYPDGRCVVQYAWCNAKQL